MSRWFPDDEHPEAVSPFTPGFGSTPPHMAGREDLLREVCGLLAGNPASDGGTNLLVGPRGYGKTVLLNEIADAATTERGWVVLEVSGSDGDLVAETHKAVLRARSALAEVAIGQGATRQISGVRLGTVGLSVGVDFRDAPDPPRPLGRYGDDLRYDLSDLVSGVGRAGSRVLLSVDEMHSVPLTQARKLGSYIQHIAKREKGELCFVGAALPAVKDTLLTDKGSTFLHRMAVHDVDLLTDSEVLSGLVEPLAGLGMSVDDEAAEACVAGVSGLPYMLQLVGDRAWRKVHADSQRVDAATAAAAVADASRTLAGHLFAPTWAALSDADKRFADALRAMGGSGRSRQAAALAGIADGSVSAYRRRAIQAGVMRPTGRGFVEFAHPMMQQWLEDSRRSGAASVPPAPLPGLVQRRS